MIALSVYAMRSYGCRAVLAVALLCAAPHLAGAAEFHVNTTLDLVDLSPFDDECNAGPAPGGGVLCSLRAAIMEVNRRDLMERHIIHVPAGVYQLVRTSDESLPGAGEDERQIFGFTGAIGNDTYNDLDIGVNVEIIGAGEGITIIQGRSTDRVFHITNWSPHVPGSPSYVRIANLTIRGGGTLSRGAGISITAVREAVLEDVTIEDNVGTYFSEIDGVLFSSVGGGVYTTAADLFITRGTIRNNRAGAGGGLAIGSGWTTVVDTTFEGNEARGSSVQIVGGTQGMGGAIAVLHSEQRGSFLEMSGSTLSGNLGNLGGGIGAWGPFRVVNSTLSGNTGLSRGGGAYVRTPVAANFSQFDFSTIVHNTADLGGGVYRDVFGDSNLQLQHSMVAVNRPDNCASTPSPRSMSGGHNLEDTNVCGFSRPTDLRFRVPRIRPLADNGGPTETHALMGDSPAIDRAGMSSYRVDQRGVARPQGAGMDIGAFEFFTPQFTPYRMPEGFRTLFGFSIPLQIRGTSNATITGIVPASDEVKLSISIDKSGKFASVSASDLKIDLDELKKKTGQKRPVLFYVAVESDDGGSEMLEIVEPRFDGTLKDVTKLPISQK